MLEELGHRRGVLLLVRRHLGEGVLQYTNAVLLRLGEGRVVVMMQVAFGFLAPVGVTVLAVLAVSWVLVEVDSLALWRSLVVLGLDAAFRFFQEPVLELALVRRAVLRCRDLNRCVVGTRHGSSL